MREYKRERDLGDVDSGLRIKARRNKRIKVKN